MNGLWYTCKILDTDYGMSLVQSSQICSLGDSNELFETGKHFRNYFVVFFKRVDFERCREEGKSTFPPT